MDPRESEFKKLVDTVCDAIKDRGGMTITISIEIKSNSPGRPYQDSDFKQIYDTLEEIKNVFKEKK